MIDYAPLVVNLARLLVRSNDRYHQGSGTLDGF